MAAVEIDAKEFVANLRRFTDGLMPEEIIELKKKTASDILTRVVQKSPVDTGRFRGNWQVSLRQPIRSTVKGIRSAGETLREGLAKIERVSTRHDIWITNNVAYAVKLEFGHSGQAPAGVVGPTLNELGLS